MNQNSEHTPLSALGEFGLIEHLTKDLASHHPETELGVGDDCAVIKCNSEERLLLSTDILLEGVHFDLTYFPLKHLGYKAAAVNLSDIYAMNARPAHLLVALGLSARFSLAHVEELYEGIKTACAQYEVDLIGGDTSTSLTGLTISITAAGYAQPEQITYRSGARANEVIFVSGDLGAAYLGLRLLEREKRVLESNSDQKPQFKGHEYLLARILKPEPRADVVNALREAQITPTAMIDISDGLSSELLHLAKSSKIGCRIFAERIPIAEQTKSLANEMNLPPLTAALNGGEDYELLFTAPLDCQKQLEELGLTAIGYTTPPERGIVLVNELGEERPLIAQGWNAYPTEQPS